MPAARLTSLLLACLSQIASADDSQSPPLPNHSVTVTEYQWDSEDDAVPTIAEMTANLTALLKKRKIASPVSYVFSAVEQTKSTLTVVKTIDASDERRTREVFIGTTISVLIKPENGKLSVEFSYLDTRLGGETDKRGFPIPVVSQFTATQTVDPGEKNFVSNGRTPDRFVVFAIK